jgi:hypothetical protein
LVQDDKWQALGWYVWALLGSKEEQVLKVSWIADVKLQPEGIKLKDFEI